MCRRGIVLLLLSLSACSFSVDYDGAHYACEPPDGVCPAGSTCGPQGFCVPAAGGPIDAAVADAPDNPDPPDADPLAPDGGMVTVSFGERPGSDVGGVTTDTDLNSTATNENNGGYSDLYVAFLSDGRQSVGLMRFDVSTIPTGATVTDASLELYTRGDALTVGEVVFFRMLEAWDEGNGTADPGVANFDQRQPGTPWLTPGGFPPSSSATPLVQLVPDTTDTAFTVALPAELVQDWVNDPTSNFGMMLFVPGQTGDVSFDSSESNTSDRRPELRVTFLP